MSLLELLPSRVNPGALAQSCHSSSSCPVMLLLELLPCRVTPVTLASSFLCSSGVLLSHFACRGRKSKFFDSQSEKKLYPITHIVLFFVCNVCTVHNGIAIMFSFSVCINVHPLMYIVCTTLYVFANVVFCFGNRFPVL